VIRDNFRDVVFICVRRMS